MTTSVLRRPMQVGAFLRKESIDALRQPRLLLVLVFGPFLVMAAFALGYRDTPEPMRTMFVAPAGSHVLDNVDSYAKDIGSYIKYKGSTSDAAYARQQLLDGKIDLIVTFPDKPLDTILSGQPAPVTITHTRLDPIEQTAIDFAARLGIDQINGQIVAKVVGDAQNVAQPLGDLVTSASSALDRLESAQAAGDTAAAQKAGDDLSSLAAQIDAAAQASAAINSQLSTGGTNPQSDVSSGIDELRSLAASIRANPNSTQDVARMREVLGGVSKNFDQFATVDPQVLVKPFTSEVELAVPKTHNVTDWYAPAAIVLMLQQFGVAFGALSFVRERQLGIVDVYRVAPIDAGETLIGKYIAYLLIGGAIAALLTALIVVVLDVPMASSIDRVAVVLALTLFASIGLGFVISLISATDAQAVQYTMIVLLASLFFSGFFLSVGRMQGVARYIGWLLPVTYGMDMLRDVMLRGVNPSRNSLIGLSAYGVIAFALALYGTRRRMTTAS